MEELLTHEDEVQDRRREYFVQHLNGDKIRGIGDGESSGGEIDSERICWREVEIEEILGTLKKRKGGKTSGLTGIGIELLEYCGSRVTKWLLRLFNRYMKRGTVPQGQNVVYIILAYKEK